MNTSEYSKNQENLKEFSRSIEHEIHDFEKRIRDICVVVTYDLRDDENLYKVDLVFFDELYSFFEEEKLRLAKVLTSAYTSIFSDFTSPDWYSFVHIHMEDYHFAHINKMFGQYLLARNKNEGELRDTTDRPHLSARRNAMSTHGRAQVEDEFLAEVTTSNKKLLEEIMFLVQKTAKLI